MVQPCSFNIARTFGFFSHHFHRNSKQLDKKETGAKNKLQNQKKIHPPKFNSSYPEKWTGQEKIEKILSFLGQKAYFFTGQNGQDFGPGYTSPIKTPASRAECARRAEGQLLWKKSTPSSKKNEKMLINQAVARNISGDIYIYIYIYYIYVIFVLFPSKKKTSRIQKSKTCLLSKKFSVKTHLYKAKSHHAEASVSEIKRPFKDPLGDTLEI